MNFLAHFQLSDNDAEIALGNYLGDFIRPKDAELLPEKVRLGWKLHNAIDQFTDSHETVLKSKERSRKIVRKYAPVLVDIYYDYFLANNWNKFEPTSLRNSTSRYYLWISSASNLLPNKAKRFYDYAIKYDIFYNYQFYDGLAKTLQGMSQRASFESNLTKGVDHLKVFRAEYEEEFFEFYPQLQTEARTYLQKHQS